MKTIFSSLRLIFIIIIFSIFFVNKSYSQGVGISDAAITPDASSMLEIRSTSKGVLVPRMTTTNRTAITSPANGLLVYDTDLQSFYYYNSGWKSIYSSSNSGILIGVRVLTSGTSYTPTAGTNAILVKVVGGGGGGGGMGNCSSNAGASGGGGAGGYSERYYTTAGKTFTYSVGVGGVAGASGNSVTASVSSTFTDGTSSISGGSGSGGATMTAATTVANAIGGTGGTSTGGTLNVPGSDGGFGLRISATCIFSGSGGYSQLGSGGVGVATGPATSSIAGNSGDNYGAGGSGAVNLKTNGGGAGAVNGGNGSAGVVIIYEYK